MSSLTFKPTFYYVLEELKLEVMHRAIEKELADLRRQIKELAPKIPKSPRRSFKDMVLVYHGVERYCAIATFLEQVEDVVIEILGYMVAQRDMSQRDCLVKIIKEINDPNVVIIHGSSREYKIQRMYAYRQDVCQFFLDLARMDASHVADSIWWDAWARVLHDSTRYIALIPDAIIIEDVKFCFTD